MSMPNGLSPQKEWAALCRLQERLIALTMQSLGEREISNTEAAEICMFIEKASRHQLMSFIASSVSLYAAMRMEDFEHEKSSSEKGN